MNKPIFVIGSPRSGTSILTWCIGRHPNIIALDESTGIGDLATALAICYQTKIGLSTDSLWTAMNVQEGEFFAAFGKAINELILRHQVDLERRRWEEAAGPNAPPYSFVTEQSARIPKGRWVDGTPVYSFHVCGLRKLFPEAQFIHIVRDVTSVVRSMLNFHRLGGVKLFTSEQEAYDYWFRAVSSCLLAEQAYGPSVVFRLPYSELVDQPEASLRALLNFLGEPYAPECLTPLRKKINSSNVPDGFKLGSSGTDPALVERADRLYAGIKAVPQALAASATATDEIEQAFGQQAQYVATLEQHLNNEREQMREGYETEVRRINTECEQIRNRAKRLAKEVQNKRAIIRDLRARSLRHKLRGFLFSHNLNAQSSNTELRTGDAAERNSE